MPLLIDEDQTGLYMIRRKRKKEDNIQRALYIIDYVNRGKNSAIPLSLDAEKVFDSVDWEFLYQVMDRFGFSKGFIQCIKTAYSSLTVRIKMNGSHSNSIVLQ